LELTIRKLITMGSGAAALCVVAAFVVAPATALAEGSHRSHATTESTQALTATVDTVTAPTQACTDARVKLATAAADDRVADAAEKAALKNGSLTKDAKKKLDVAERAAMKTLRDAARAACAGQGKTPPTAACLAAKQALKDALKAHKDTATLKGLKDKKKAACTK
jgi:hypothetical protein